MLVRNKNRMRDTLRSSYTKVPNELFGMHLSGELIGFAAYLLSLPEEFNPSVSYLAEHFKVSKSTVKRWFDVLQTRNIISLVEAGDFRTKKVKKFQLEPRTKWKSYGQENTNKATTSKKDA